MTIARALLLARAPKLFYAAAAPASLWPRPPWTAETSAAASADTYGMRALSTCCRPPEHPSPHSTRTAHCGIHAASVPSAHAVRRYGPVQCCAALCTERDDGPCCAADSRRLRGRGSGGTHVCRSTSPCNCGESSASTGTSSKKWERSRLTKKKRRTRNKSSVGSLCAWPHAGSSRVLYGTLGCSGPSDVCAV
jgi:hypothetical protein